MTAIDDTVLQGSDTETSDGQLVASRIDQLLAEHDPVHAPAREFLGAQYDCGLAWVHHPVGLGGLDVSHRLQRIVTQRLYDAGTPSARLRNPIGIGHAAPTIITHGTDPQRSRYLRPMFTGEEFWCQLFSEPGAGSDDLKDAAGAEQLLRLVDAADFLLEGYRPGVMERLGLGPDVCLARNPRLVYVRITGWGQTGPLAQRAGHDINYIALTGALGSIGPRSTPVAPLNLLGDYAGGGMLAAFGILAALIERNRSGEGQVIDAAMIDGASYLMAPFFELHRSGDWSAERADNLLDGGAPFYGTYPTADGRHLAVGALEPQFFAEFRRGVGLETHPALSAQYDRSTWPSMRTAIAQRVLQHPLQHWEDLFGGTDACVAPVLGLDDVPHHAHHRARSSHMADLLPAAAPRFSRTPGSRRSVTHPPASDAPEGQ